MSPVVLYFYHRGAPVSQTKAKKDSFNGVQNCNNLSHSSGTETQFSVPFFPDLVVNELTNDLCHPLLDIIHNSH